MGGFSGVRPCLPFEPHGDPRMILLDSSSTYPPTTTSTTMVPPPSHTADTGAPGGINWMVISAVGLVILAAIVLRAASERSRRLRDES